MKKQIIFLLSLLLAVSIASGFFGSQSDRGEAALISLDGQIVPSSDPGAFSGGGALTPRKLRNLNSKARQNNVDAIIYEINSGGGSVVASKELMRAIDSVEIPTVCRFRDVSASGAYLTSLGCDKIVADSATLTGSIGVKSSYLEFSGLLDEYNIEYVNISSGKYKEVGSPFKNTTEEDKRNLKNKTEIIHEQFVSEVQDRRNLTDREAEQVGTGELFLGSKAKKYGLVDELGGRSTALITAENLTDKNLTTRRIESESAINLFSLLSSSKVSSFIDMEPTLKAQWR